MKVTKAAAHDGPNLFAPFSVIHVQVDLGPLEAWTTGRLGADFAQGLAAALPELAGKDPGFLKEVTAGDGVSLARVAARVAVELQRLAGFQVDFFETRPAGRAGIHDIILSFEDIRVGMEASRTALNLTGHLLPGERRAEAGIKGRLDLKRTIDGFLAKARERVLDPFTAALVRAAEARDIPWRRAPHNPGAIRFGQGCYQKYAHQALNSDTRLMGVGTARNKKTQVYILQALGLPVPRRSVASDEDTAIGMANHMGFPLYIAPKDGPEDRGFIIYRSHFGGVGAAYREVCPDGGPAVVGNYLEGRLHRFLTVGGRVVAARRYETEMRGHGLQKALREADNNPDLWSDMAIEGQIHGDNRMVVEMAAKSLGLDVANVDFLTPDIGQSYHRVGGRLMGVNPSPDLAAFQASEDTADLGGLVMDLLYPPGSPSRIPIAAITGTNGKTTTTRMLSHILKCAGYTAGHSTTLGIYVDDTLIEEGDRAGNSGAGMILANPSVDAAVLETARGGLVKGGMGYDACTVSAVLNVSDDHLGQDGIETVEQMAEVKRIVVTGTRDAVVLNADDPLCVPMAGHAKTETVCYFTVRADNHLVLGHIGNGGPAMVFDPESDGGPITFFIDGTEKLLMAAGDIPATYDCRALFNVQNAMAAAAMAHFLKVPMDAIRQGLKTFGTSFDQLSGRLNIRDDLPFPVILDYAHNPAGLRAFVAMLEKFPVEGRRIGVVNLIGRNSDETYFETGHILAGAFDYYICRQSGYLFDRESGEAPRLLQESLIAAGVESDRITVILEEQEAVETALGLAQPGDLVVIFAHKIQRTWDQITSFVYRGDDAR